MIKTSGLALLITSGRVDLAFVYAIYREASPPGR